MPVWAVDTCDALALCMRAGLDAVISNRPRDVVHWREECRVPINSNESPAWGVALARLHQVIEVGSATTIGVSNTLDTANSFAIGEETRYRVG